MPKTAMGNWILKTIFTAADVVKTSIRKVFAGHNRLCYVVVYWSRYRPILVLSLFFFFWSSRCTEFFSNENEKGQPPSRYGPHFSRKSPKNREVKEEKKKMRFYFRFSVEIKKSFIGALRFASSFPPRQLFRKGNPRRMRRNQWTIEKSTHFKKKKHSTFPANPVPVFVLFFPLQSIDRVDFLKLGDPIGRRWGKIKEIKESFVSSFLLSFIHSVLFRHRFVWWPSPLRTRS